MTGIFIRGGLVLTRADAEPVRADVLIEGDRISSVGGDVDAPTDAQVVDAREFLVIPGLVNAHTHAHNHLAKGAIDGLPLEVWLQYLAAWVVDRSPRDVYVGAVLGAVEMVRTGTTCVCDMAQFIPWPTDSVLDAVAQAYADVGLRATISPQVFDLPFLQGIDGLEARVPSEIRDGLLAQPAYPSGDVLATVGRAAQRWRGTADGRIRFGIGPSSFTICSDAFMGTCLDLSREHDLSFQTHLSETKAEAITAWRRYGTSATAHLRELGVLGTRTVLAHCVWLDDEEIELIAESGATVAHNPVSNLKLGSGIAPVSAMRARGCNVAVGTDGSASSDNQNLFGALRLAALLPRVQDPEYARWPRPADVLSMATLGGARAAGLEGRIGAIAPGYEADLILLDLSSSYYHPRNDLLGQLVHCDEGASVHTVVIDGRIVVRGGQVVTVDTQALFAEADEIAARMSREMESRARTARQLEPYVREAYLSLSRSDWPVDR